MLHCICKAIAGADIFILGADFLTNVHTTSVSNVFIMSVSHFHKCKAILLGFYYDGEVAIILSYTDQIHVSV